MNLAAGTWQNTLLESLPQRYGPASVAISPDLSRALYVAQAGQGFQLVLWDYEKGSALWSTDDYYSPRISNHWLISEAWSPDSSQVAFALKPPTGLDSQLVVLSRNADKLSIALGLNEKAGSNAFDWSPDSRFLAAVVGSLDNPAWSGGNIIVYSRIEDRIVAVCRSPNVGSPTEPMNTYGPQWSPDSRFVVFGNGQDFLSQDNGILAFNPATGQTILLRQGLGVSFVGWSPISSWGNTQ